MVLWAYIQSWLQSIGQGQFPKRIIYFRDGVSEGQYQRVLLQQEGQDMKEALKTANPNLNIPSIVIIGSKRHHVRMFPQNGKPSLRTFFKNSVTNPFGNDF